MGTIVAGPSQGDLARAELQARLNDLADALRDPANEPGSHSTQANRINYKNFTDAWGHKMVAEAPARSPWESLFLFQANETAKLGVRITQNAATIDHLANLAFMGVDQSGATQNQQPNSPVRTAAADALAANAAPVNRTIDAVQTTSTGAVQAAIDGIATALAKQVDASVTDALSALTETLANVQANLNTLIANGKAPTTAA